MRLLILAVHLKMEDRGDSGREKCHHTQLAMAVPWDSDEPAVLGLQSTKSNSTSSYGTASTRRARHANL
jgi:hypothetical protein